MSADRDPLLGKVVAGRYRIERRIGRGGMGSIYEVAHTKLGRSFALKTLSWELANDTEVLARFQREADIVAKLRHPNIVEIVDWDQLDDGTPCLIMEYLRGEDLSQRIRRASPLPWSVIARVGDQVISALAVAHKAGIVHRDLKPQNIFLALDDAGEERAKLLDFGVSKIRDSQSFATTDAKLIGTPAYMSPEQADGAHAEVGNATDVWAMGAILHEMATGRLAFEAINMPAILYRICHKGADDVRLKRPDAPTAFAELLERALDRDPSTRLREADELRAGLRKALSGMEDVEYEEPMRSPSVVTQPKLLAKDGAELATGPTLAATPDAAAVGVMPTTLGSSIGESMPRAQVPEPTKKGRGLAIGLGAVVLAGVAGVAIMMSSGGGGGGSKTASAPAVDAAVRTTTPVDAAVAAPAIAPDATDTVELTVQSTPSDATVYRRPSNAAVGKTPYTFKEPRGSGKIELVIEMDGRKPREVTFDTDANHTEKVTLEAIRGSSSGGSKSTKPKRKKGDPVDPFGDP